MTANVYWRPAPKSEPKSLYVLAPSNWRKQMEEVFGEPPWSLDRSSVKSLSAMLAMTSNRKGSENPFIQMINAINKYENIYVWMEY